MKDRLQKLRRRSKSGSSKSPRKKTPSTSSGTAAVGVSSSVNTVSSSSPPSFVETTTFEDMTTNSSRIPRKAESMSNYASMFEELVTAENNDESFEGQSLLQQQPHADGTDRKAAAEPADESVSDSVNMSIESAAKTVAKDENRVKKMATRAWYGLIMISSFVFILYSGHVYICALVALLQLLLFRELVKVRYNTYFHIIEQNIPLFRTTQWMWFTLSVFYTYSDFAVDMIKSNTALHYLLPYAQLQGTVSFLLYSGTFVLTIATMQIGYIRFQLNQLCWTICVLCLIVGQVKYIMHNVYNGLIWFSLPVLLVITNDIFAYFSGMTCGRKFIRRPFVSLSPNKTWEGFIGGAIFTLIVSWYLSRFMAGFTWLTCPTNNISFLPQKLTCDLDPIFQEANSVFPPQIFELLPNFVVKMIPAVVEMCSVQSEHPLAVSPWGEKDITACVSGEPTHVHHHFELIVRRILPIQLHALVLGMFASLVAPFGGYLASGIKRAYGIKDFDSIIPGHGGVMDRMDCQFLMALCTWVHYNTFVRITTVSVPRMLYMFNLMKESEQEEFYTQITNIIAQKGNNA